MTIKDNGPDPIDIHVGQRIRVRRIQKQLSQSAVAERMGVSFQQVQKFENAQNRVSAARIYKLARILDVDVGYFFEGIPEDMFVIPESVLNPNRLHEDKSRYDIDLMNHPESAELLKVFFDVEDAKTRRAVIEFMKRLNGAEPLPPQLDENGQVIKRKRGRPRKI